MPELRKDPTEAHRDARDRVQGVGLVQDRQPDRAEEREQRREGRHEVRHEAGHKGRHEERDDVGRERLEDVVDEERELREERGLILDALRRFFAGARLVVASFLSDECAFLAGGVAYQLFFSLIPLLALAVGVLGFIFGSERAQQEIAQLLRGVYPSANAQEARIARELVGGRAVSFGIGLVGTIFGATALFGAIDTAIARVVPGGAKRSFVRGRLQGFLFVGGILLLAVLSFALSYGAQAALAAVSLGRATRLLVGLGSPLLGFVAGVLFFYFVFRAVPRARFSRSDARLAALVSGVLWEVAKVGFAVYTRALGAFSAYGPIAFAAGLMTWIYFTSAIILVGAEVMKVRARP